MWPYWQTIFDNAMDGNLSLNRFEMFCAVIEAGSFTHAAARLGQTRAVVSFNIKQLEAELGVTLLTRTTRSVAPTDAGERFYQRCVRVLEEARIAIDEARLDHAGMRGNLRVTSTVEYGVTVLAPAMHAFMQRHPALRVRLETHTSQVDLVRERCDVAIRLGQMRQIEDSGYRGVQLDTFEIRPVMAPTLPMTHGITSIDTPDALARLPWLGHSRLENVPGWELRDPHGTAIFHRLTRQPALVADNASVIRAFSLAGAGVALLPQWLVRDDLASGRLVDALPGYQFPTQSVYALYPATRHLPRKVRLWIDFLKAHMQRLD